MDKKLKIVAISDLHNTFPQRLPDGDLLIVGGDMTMDGSAGQLVDFLQWLKSQPFKYKVVIGGNHDVSLDHRNYDYLYPFRIGKNEKKINSRDLIAYFREHCIYLENETVIVQGVKIFGSPYTPKYYEWAFNYEKGKGYQSAWKFIPSDADIVVTHGPAFGHNDLNIKKKEHGGCPELLDCLQRIQPKLHIHGHIHQSFGESKIGITRSINVSYMTRNYQPRKAPFVTLEI